VKFTLPVAALNCRLVFLINNNKKSIFHKSYQILNSIQIKNKHIYSFTGANQINICKARLIGYRLQLLDNLVMLIEFVMIHN